MRRAGTRNPHDQCGVGHQPVAHTEDPGTQRSGTVAAVPRFPAADLCPWARAAALNQLGDRSGMTVLVDRHPGRGIGIAVIYTCVGALGALDQRQYRAQ